MILQHRSRAVEFHMPSSAKSDFARNEEGSPLHTLSAYHRSAEEEARPSPKRTFGKPSRHSPVQT
jgi:hypothetical protein